MSILVLWCWYRWKIGGACLADKIVNLFFFVLSNEVAYYLPAEENSF